MPPAGQTSAARSARTASAAQPETRPHPRTVVRRLPMSKVGWDRKFRTVMMVVFAVAGFIAVKAAVSVYHAHQQAAAEQALVQSLKTQNHVLRARRNQLNQRAVIMRDARQLGMVKSGEQAFAVTGKSGN